MVLKDLTASAAFNGAQVAQTDCRLDTHGSTDSVWLAIVNASATNFLILDELGVIRGYVARYTQQSIYLSPRPILVVFHVSSNGGVQGGLTNPLLLAGFDQNYCPIDGLVLSF